MLSRAGWRTVVVLVLVAAGSGGVSSQEQEEGVLPGQSTLGPTASSKFGAGHVIGFTSPPQQPTIGALAQQAGVAWTHEDFSWHLMEPTQGVYSFSNQDTFVNNAVAFGLQVLAHLSYTPRFYSSNPGPSNYYIYPTTSPAGLTAWSNFVTATVNRYKTRIHAWQIWPNADDLAFFGGSVTNYNALLQRAYTAIKAADPTAVVVTAAMDPVFLNPLLDGGGGAFFDAVAVHNYANPSAPEVSALTTLRLGTLRDVMLRRAGSKPLWVTEYGWPSAPASSIGVSESVQSQYLIRSLLQQAAYPDVTAIMWTDFQNQAVGGVYTPEDPWDNLGMLLKIDMSKKISFNAYKAMTTALGPATLIGQRAPTKAGYAFSEGFETPRTYSLFTSNGASGSRLRTNAVAHTGNYSMQVTYSLAPVFGSGVGLAPDPGFYIPISGTPKRIKVWARGDGGPAAQLSMNFKDANGEVFGAVIGLVSGTQWKEYVYYLDALPLTSSLLVGTQDNVIQYPIQFGGFRVASWSAASPVSTGQIWVDDITYEYGSTVFDYEYSRPGEIVHALWSLDGSYSVNMPSTAASVTYRDYTNTAYTFFPSAGNVTLPVGVFPAMVSIPASAPTFADVPFTDPFWSHVEALFRSGVAAGCNYTPPQYCPSNGVTRGEMAVFLVRSRYGTGYVPPPATGTVFADVPASNPYARYIEKLVADGVTGGCGGGNYCSDFAVTRAQMAVFLLISEHGNTYAPPAPTGMFADVPVSSPYARFVERLAAEGVTGGCGGGNYCPNGIVPRNQMATFLTAVFAFARP